ncbi:hypothetical protein HYX70_04970 [Candidatus Saccharibacteria bacterium]|nr:hypothetical protein [Candidatus Saccharibacteria bacterium]
MSKIFTYPHVTGVVPVGDSVLIQFEPHCLTQPPTLFMKLTSLEEVVSEAAVALALGRSYGDDRIKLVIRSNRIGELVATPHRYEQMLDIRDAGTYTNCGLQLLEALGEIDCQGYLFFYPPLHPNAQQSYAVVTTDDAFAVCDAFESALDGGVMTQFLPFEDEQPVQPLET